MIRTASILAALLLGGTAAAQTLTAPGATLDETPEGGLEEAAALYFAPPADEEPMPAIDIAGVENAGAVALAIALGRVEEGIQACQDLRDEMQQLIGDTYGSYSVNPGWLRAYQNCLLRRGEEADAIEAAIEARQRELISRTAAATGTEDEADSEASLRAADLMARLSARQSAVRRALRQEGRMQQAFVRYYNTGTRPDILNEAPPRPAVAVPAGERPLTGPAPIRIEPPARRAPTGRDAEPARADILLPTDPATPETPAFGGALVLPEAAGEQPLSTVPGPRDEASAPTRAPASAPARATGAPMTLRSREAAPSEAGEPSSPE